ncbi:MAG: gliding motility-associated C-terminal domain-containing protein [Prevotellaceae bacterium]|jgi:gliding motility-associated-like protein|nr:gliding motility-associated C-terminal domain-containing protein [Prevotellaceae bacterium]
MKQYIPLLLLATTTPLAAHAQTQLSAPTADAVVATTSLTGRAEYIYIFFDNNPITLTATAADTSEFTWTTLNTADVRLDTIQHNDSLTTATLHAIPEGGYQVTIRNLTNPLAPPDTHTTWVFRDTFHVTGITAINSCEALELTMTSSPSLYTAYQFYNFNDYLRDSTHAGEITLHGNNTSEVLWSADNDIHKGVDNPDATWQSPQRYGVLRITTPPPMHDALYTVTVKDLFGKSSSYTMTETIPAIAVYAKITAKELTADGQETPIDDIETNPPTEAEALFRIRFSQEKSLNAHHYHWKGFADINQPLTRHTILWSDSTTNPAQWITPHTPYKGYQVDGYTPGSYNVRLRVQSATTGCIDSTEIQSIGVKPSNLNANAIPNAFTPNGDNENDIFRFINGQEPVSMEYIKISIFSRSGALVYRYQGRSDAWDGWNGKHQNTGSDLADGIYYYILTGEGWDGQIYDTAEYKGVLHIFR